MSLRGSEPSQSGNVAGAGVHFPFGEKGRNNFPHLFPRVRAYQQQVELINPGRQTCRPLVLSLTRQQQTMSLIVELKIRVNILTGTWIKKL